MAVSLCSLWLQGAAFFVTEAAPSPFTKPHLNISEQLALLKARGLEITDEDKAGECLARIGCYPLSAYWYQFRRPLADHRHDSSTPD